MKTWKRFKFIGALLIAAALSGCVTSESTASKRRQLVEQGRNELNKAHDEIIAAAQVILIDESNRLGIALDLDFRSRVDQTKAKEGGSLSTDATMAFAQQYILKRQDIDSQLLDKAHKFALIAAKITLGAQVLDAVDRIDAQREAIERQLLKDIIVQDVPTILAGLGKAGVHVDSATIGKIFGNVIPGSAPATPAK